MNRYRNEVTRKDGVTEVHTPNKIIAYGAFGGRIDHTLAAIHILSKFNADNYPEMKHTDMILMDSNSIGMMLQPGENIIFPSAEYESPVGCGLIPIGSDRCRVATTGYEWNLGKFNSSPR